MAIKERSKPPLTPLRRIKLSVLSGFVFIIILGAIFYSIPDKRAQRIETSSPQVITKQTKEEGVAKSINYRGKSGVDALTLLRQEAEVKLDRSNMVSSINGRKADVNKREYWSFFINGKMAEVGSAEYITIDTDMLEWKIQAY